MNVLDDFYLFYDGIIILIPYFYVIHKIQYKKFCSQNIEFKHQSNRLYLFMANAKLCLVNRRQE